MSSKTCPRCGNRKFYRLRRGKFRCKDCLYEFKPKLGGLRLKKNQWKNFLTWFVLGHSLRTIEEQTNLSRYSVFKAARITRKIMFKDVPDDFEGIIEVDETYLGGQKKNKRKSQLIKEEKIFGKSKRGFGTTKQAVFGILCRSGKVYAKLVDNTEAKDLVPIITKRVKSGARICSDTWRAYTGLATRGYVHRTVEHRKKEYTKGKNHINGLEGFWGYLKRKLAAKGGIQRKYLHLFLGEYVWRYNHRQMNTKERVNRLLSLIEDFSG